MINYSFIPIPREIFSLLNDAELKLFVMLVDQCEKYEKQGKFFFRSCRDLSNDLGWGKNSIKLMKTLQSLENKNLISVKKGTYSGNMIANEYYVNWDYIKNVCHQNSDRVEDNNNSVCHQNSDTTKNLYYYTMQFKKIADKDVSSEDIKSIENVINELSCKLSKVKNNAVGEQVELAENSKVTNENTITSTLREDYYYTMQPPTPNPQTQNKGAGEAQDNEVDKLPTSIYKTQPDASKEQNRLFNLRHDNNRTLLKNFKTLAEFDKAVQYLHMDVAWVANSDWSEVQKETWNKNYDYFVDRCAGIVEKKLNQIENKHKKIK